MPLFSSLQATGLLDSINSLSGEVTETLKIVGGAVVLFLIVVVLAQSRLTMTRLIVAGLCGGFALWLIGSGMGWFSQGIGEQVQNTGGQQVALSGRLLDPEGS